MLLEERAPLVVEQRAVGLEIVLDALVGLLVFLLELDHLVEELEPEQRRLATLPGEDHFVAVLAFDVLLDVGLENFVGDLELAVAAQQLFFVQVIAIGAVDVADGADRLDHRVIGAGCARQPGAGERSAMRTRSLITVRCLTRCYSRRSERRSTTSR